MKFQKGNKLGGRKKLTEEIKDIKEVMKQQTIEELAESKVHNHIKMTKSGDRQGIKDIALPVYLKSKADKKELSGKLTLETITGMEVTKDEDQIQD